MNVLEWQQTTSWMGKTPDADYERCIASPMFHTYTGCDNYIVSSFCCRGKKSAWDTWMNIDDVTTAFCTLAATPDVSTIDDWMEPLERFVILFYDHTSSLESVNQVARKQLFTQNGLVIDGLLPQDKQH